MGRIRLSFGKTDTYIADYNYTSSVILKNEVVINFYKMLSFYKKSEIEGILINSSTLKELEKKLNAIGFYLYMVRHLKNVNYFYIIKDNVKNKILYNNASTLAFIDNSIDIIDSVDIKRLMGDKLDLSDLD